MINFTNIRNVFNYFELTIQSGNETRNETLQVNSSYEWIAVDSDGGVFGYKSKPIHGSNFWQNTCPVWSCLGFIENATISKWNEYITDIRSPMTVTYEVENA